MNLYKWSIKKSYVNNNWSINNNNSLNKLNKSSSTSYKRLDNNNLDKLDNSDNNNINYTIKTKNWQNVLKAYILSLKIFKLTLCQSSIRANNLDNDNNYLLDNNEDYYKMFFSQNSSQNFLSLSLSQDY